MGKAKVLYYSLIETDPTSFYRSSGVLPYLQSDEYEIINGSRIEDWSWAVFIDIKIFFIQRPFREEHLKIIELARTMGCKVISDYDDNVLQVDQNNPVYASYNGNKAIISKCIICSNEVWVSTKGIKDEFEELNDNIHVVPNAHNDFLFKIEDKKPYNPKTQIVMWRGGLSHEADVYEKGDYLIETINENTDWTFEFWGARFLYMEQRCGDNYISKPQVDLMQYFNDIHEANPNVFFYPLCDTEMNRCKSNISFIESTYSGAAFYGENEFDEFSDESILNVSDLNHDLSVVGVSMGFEQANKEAWQYILDNLLLSDINKIRDQRIKSNL